MNTRLPCRNAPHQSVESDCFHGSSSCTLFKSANQFCVQRYDAAYAWLVDTVSHLVPVGRHKTAWHEHDGSESTVRSDVDIPRLSAAERGLGERACFHDPSPRQGVVRLACVTSPADAEGTSCMMLCYNPLPCTTHTCTA